MSPAEAVERRSWRIWSWAGAFPALLLQYWMLTAGTWNLFRWNRVSDFYDAQAHSWLDGHWSISERVLGIEAFLHDGKAFMYQGPIPAVLRVPVVAFTDRMDGRLTAASMLCGFVLAAWSCQRLGWRVRHLVRGDAPLDRGDRVVAALMSASVIGGSSLLFASSRAWVYHEAIIWGVAFTVASAAYLVEWIDTRRIAAFRWAALFSGLAFLTRASVGAGSLAAIVLVGACDSAHLVRRHTQGHPRVDGLLRRLSWTLAPEPAAPPVESVEADESVESESGEPASSAPIEVVAPAVASGPSWRWVRAPFLASWAIVVSYSACNYAKFGSFIKVPFETQVFTLVDADRQRMLALNGGSLFSSKFIPTNLLQYWRPDMLGFTGRFPFITFPAKPTTVIGDLQFDLLDKTASLPATMPHLVLLALIGTVVVVMGRQRLGLLRVPLLGALAGTVTVVNIGYTANRYQSDFLPLLVLGAWAGLFVTMQWWRTRTPVRRRSVAGLLLCLGVFGLFANLALGYFFQRAYGPVTSPTLLAGYLDTQLDVDSALGDGRIEQISVGAELPAGGDLGDVFIVEGCTAVYWSDGMATNEIKRTNWNGVERSDEAGAVDATVVFEQQPKGTREELVASLTGFTTGTVYVEYLGGDAVRFVYIGPGQSNIGAPVHIDFDEPYHLNGWFDRRVQEVDLFLDEQLVLAAYFEGDVPLQFGGTRVGAMRGLAPFSGSIERHEVGTALCERLLAART